MPQGCKIDEQLDDPPLHACKFPALLTVTLFFKVRLEAIFVRISSVLQDVQTEIASETAHAHSHNEAFFVEILFAANGS